MADQLRLDYGTLLELARIFGEVRRDLDRAREVAPPVPHSTDAVVHHHYDVVRPQDEVLLSELSEIFDAASKGSYQAYQDFKEADGVEETASPHLAPGSIKPF